MQMKPIIIILITDSLCSVPKTIVIGSKMTTGKYCKDRTFHYSVKKLLSFLKSILNVELFKVTNLENGEAEIQIPATGLQQLQLKITSEQSNEMGDIITFVCIVQIKAIRSCISCTKDPQPVSSGPEICVLLSEPTVGGINHNAIGADLYGR